MARASAYTVPTSKELRVLAHACQDNTHTLESGSKEVNNFRDSFILGAGKFSCSLLVKTSVINPFYCGDLLGNMFNLKIMYEKENKRWKFSFGCQNMV